MVDEAAWSDREEIHHACSRVAAEVLGSMSGALNELHGVAKPTDYWELVLGFWTRNFVDLVSSRCEELQCATGAVVSDLSETGSIARAGRLMGSLNRQSQSVEWNHRLTADIAALQKGESIKAHPAEQFLSVDLTAKRGVLRVLVEGAKSRSIRLASSRGVVIVSSYLPTNAEAVLALSLSSVPVRWPHEPYSTSQLDVVARRRLASMLAGGSRNGLEGVVIGLLPWYLPMSVIEDFDVMRSRIATNGRCPKVIFTANLHCSSDSFAIWAAEQRLRGAVLAISQHGGLNGQGRLPTRGEEFEREVADLYLHWGWAEGDNAQRIPAQIVAWAPPRRKQNVSGGVLLVTDATFRHNRRPWAGVEDLSLYLEMLFTTYGSLPEDVKSQTIVRLHKDHALYDDSHEVKWRARYPHCTLDSGFGPMAPLVDNARLVVCTTLGTTEIEQFSRNVPTVLRLDRHIHALRRGEEDLFERMENVGLVHYSAESLASFLRAQWNSLGDWWSDPAVVSVVQRYLARFGHQSSRPVRDIRAVLREASAQRRSR